MKWSTALTVDKVADYHLLSSSHWMRLGMNVLLFPLKNVHLFYIEAYIDCKVCWKTLWLLWKFQKYVFFYAIFVKKKKDCRSTYCNICLNKDQPH